YSRNFVIFDSADQQTLVKDCIKELNLNEKNFPYREVLSNIGRAKDELIEPDIYAKMNAGDYHLDKMAKIYELYQKKLKNNNALDFDDIILMTIKLFLDNPPVLEHYQRKFKYILVDEYQDTNTAQYTLISLLAQGYRNLCVVGDDDQSIYGWRGANIRNILDFEKEFKGCKVVKLEQNYRSTQSILNAANNVIKNNTGRKRKSLWTENPVGGGIQVFEGGNEHEEAFFVTREIKRLMQNENRNYRDFAVLYRMNAQSRVLEETLMKDGIPYRIFGGLRFYDRKEIKDIIAYLRLIQNPSDDIALKRIINIPRRGIGNTTVDTAENVAISRNCSIFSIVSSASEVPELQRAASRLEEFTSMVNGFKAQMEGMSVPELIGEVIQKSGILAELEAENTIEARSRIENIKEMISSALEFEEQNEEKGLEAFLANVSLVSDIDNLESEKDTVVLMTLHSAKGLEFPAVFMVGMEEGVFPGLRSMGDDNELEEERRLCYVGMTRAKEKLYMTNTFSRTLLGNTTYNKASRFLKEIPPEFIDSGTRPAKKADSFTGRAGKSYNSGWDSNFSAADSRASGKSSGLNSSTLPFVNQAPVARPASVVCFKPGDNVVHKKFGVGTITLVEKDKDDFRLEIQFRNYGMRRLMAAYANLTKL
ncbi:MAG: ATP-dependent DNA helicase PcrA, partial [Ruminiclostridium sp.]|nr:ATP-dependent DNA helicase PcrA [Ruminiclostridium sp.]